jgi:hypothetical protein
MYPAYVRSQKAFGRFAQACEGAGSDGAAAEGSTQNSLRYPPRRGVEAVSAIDTRMEAPAKAAAQRGSVRFVTSCSENHQSLFGECCRLVDPTKLRKLLAWLRDGREAGDVSVDFIVTFSRFWHEAIVAGLDTEALLDFALNWHLAASAKGHTKSAASRYWLTVRALEEIGLLDTPVSKPHRTRKGKQK